MVNAFRLSLANFMGVFIQDLREIYTDVCDSLVLQIVFISLLTELRGQDAVVLATVCK